MVFEVQRRQLWEVYKQSRIRRGIKAAFVILIVVAVFIIDTVPTYLSLEENILFLVVLTILSLEVIESTVYEIENDLEEEIQQQLHEIEDELDSNRSPRVFRNTRDAYSSLGESMNDLSEGCVYLIHYLGSSFSTRHAITSAKDNGFDIYLLLKHPATVNDPSMITNEEIKDQVFRFIEQILPSYFKEYENLHVRFYPYQASVNAIKISKQNLAVGWYTFHDKNGQPRKVNDDLNPTLVFNRNSADYDVMNEWFKDTFTELWKDAFTLTDMYERGDTTQLTEWVDQDKLERKSLLERMSADHPQEQDKLFQDS